jgi:CubicO group peptidase (beta-lactamase class C family)
MTAAMQLTSSGLLMHTLKRKCLWLPALLFVAVLCPRGLADDLPKIDARAAGLSGEGVKKLDALLDDAVQKKQVAGAVALVMRHGKLGYLRAAGWQDAEAKTPMAADTLFRIASMTKPITSVAAMMLVEEGKLRLDDPVSKYLPEFKGQKVLAPGQGLVPADRDVTVRDLLTHTSGITYRFRGGDLGGLYARAGVSDGLSPNEGTIAENVKRLAAQPLLFQPGTAWEYGLNTDVLGRVIEVASGKDLAAFFRERVFAPLGMHDTSFFLPEGRVARLAALYTVGPDKELKRVGEEPVTAGPLVYAANYPYKGSKKYYSGGAGLVSTAADYARFLQMLLNGGEYGGKRLLRAETVKEMTKNQIGDKKMWITEHGDGFGYGFGVESGKAKGPAPAGTYSWGGIFNTYFFVDPQKEVVAALMTQLFPSDHLTVRPDFQKRVYEALAD